jgi:hypothetical protein
MKLQRHTSLAKGFAICPDAYGEASPYEQMYIYVYMKTTGSKRKENRWEMTRYLYLQPRAVPAIAAISLLYRRA